MFDGIPNNRICFLLLPGFAPDNVPMLGLKKELEALGYSVVATNFWGNGKVSNFSTVTIEQCKQGIADIVSELSATYDVVIGIGVSLGGALLLEHAKNSDDINYIVSIGTPFKLKLRNLIAVGFAVYPFFRPLWNQMQKVSSWRLLPLGAAREVVGYLNGDFSKDLENIKTPTLLVHSKSDFLADYSVVDAALARFSSTHKKAIYPENTDHTINYDNALIIGALTDFIHDK